MLLEVRVFGGLAERIGGARTTLQLHDAATVADLRAAVVAEHPAIAPFMRSVMVAVDLEVADDTRPLAGAREVALLPPVAGGAEPPAGAPPVVITGIHAPPLDVDATLAAIRTSSTGATVSFLGTVRDLADDGQRVVGLDYQAYEAMAERVLADLAHRLLAEHPEVQGIALLHAHGSLAVGEHSVLVACTAAHRGPAFAACAAALEAVKDEVPVFKRERLADGSHHWVGLDPHPATSTDGPGGVP